MKYAFVLAVAGLLAAASPPAAAAVYYGPADVSSFFMTTGNLPQNGLFVGANASANTTVTIQNQTIRFSATTVTLQAQTYSGTFSNTLQISDLLNMAP